MLYQLLEDTNAHTIIKTFSARYTSSHYTDIYTRYVNTDIWLKFNDQVTRGFTQIK
jgi:hypothetical protein